MFTADSDHVTDTLNEKAARYILERHLKEGGFCFYRMNEPSGADTYWAVAALETLGVPFKDKKTIRYLQGFQHPDGSYESVYHAYYAIKSLQLLDEEPDSYPVPYILKKAKIHDVNRMPAGGASIFKGLYHVIDLAYSLDMDLGRKLRQEIVRFVLRYQIDSTGFGHPHATLVDTFHALKILAWLGYPLDRLGTENFVKKCETPVFGFVNVPRTAPAFIEHIFAGTSSSVVLSRKSRYRGRCIDFISGCQRRNGGFSRTTHGGIATLEYTFLAVHTLKSLSAPE
ncbi:MAG TPA: prenyltransferase/squalene oxidase repeat-containing protein [Syntrophales bacterium]|nr:prenyltransferase/squalene oxidase repeat-containing protein [Syntrophales bacterium]